MSNKNNSQDLVIKIDDDGFYATLNTLVPVNGYRTLVNKIYELFIPEDYSNSTIEISFDVNLTKVKKERKFKDDSIPFHIKKQRGIL